MKYRDYIIIFILFICVLFLNNYVSAGDCASIPWSDMKLSAQGGARGGEVVLRWKPVFFANHYSLVYGTRSKQYLYGGLDIGMENSNSYTVKSLKPGTRYYFKLSAGRDCIQGNVFSKEVSAVSRR